VPRVTAALVLVGTVVVSGCRGAAVAPESDRTWARSALIPTFTPLAPPTATLTPLPTDTPETPYSTPTPDVFEAAGPVVRLEIPAIGVDAVVERVGRLPDGSMDTPKLPGDVAWFTESALPGQPVDRPAVIAGHLDSPTGPAVFYDLRQLVPGDEIAVTYQNGSRYVFTVVNKERYPFDNAPVDKIFGSNPERMLNLITCDGAWDSGHANYGQRLVIYTRLKADARPG
jgi:sortase (surface protein transpeptidase)